MSEKRELEYKDRFVLYLQQTLSDRFDTEADFPTLPFTDLTTRHTLTIDVNAREYTQILSAIMTGGDLAFPDIAHELELIWTDAKELIPVDSVPIGTIFNFVGLVADIPAKYLLCNGATLDGADYPELFAIMPPDMISGSDFTLPALSNRYIRNTVDDSLVGDFTGALNHTLSIAELPAHHHVVPAHAHTVPARANAGSTSGVAALAGAAANATIATDTEAATDTSDVGSGNSFGLIPPSQSFLSIIKALP